MSLNLRYGLEEKINESSRIRQHMWNLLMWRLFAAEGEDTVNRLFRFYETRSSRGFLLHMHKEVACLGLELGCQLR